MFISTFSADSLRNAKKVFVAPLSDQTGVYKELSFKFDSLAALSLQSDVFEVNEGGNWDAFRRSKYQNAVMPATSRNETEFIVYGDVERISYEPVINVRKQITSFALLGLVGLALSEEKGAMTSYVQYRFYLKDIQGRDLSNFVIIGVASGLPKTHSRKQLTIEANLLAACSFRQELVFQLMELGLVDVRKTATKFIDEAESKRKCIESINIPKN